MTDPLITRDKFIEYVAPLVVDGKPSEVIATACLKTGFGKYVYGRNLFRKEWFDGCGYPYVEVKVRKYEGGRNIGQIIKLRKYRSWTDSMKDYEIDGNVQGIIKLYDLEKYDKEVD